MRERLRQMEAAGFDARDIRTITAVFFADDRLVVAWDPPGLL